MICESCQKNKIPVSYFTYWLRIVVLVEFLRTENYIEDDTYRSVHEDLMWIKKAISDADESIREKENDNSNQN